LYFISLLGLTGGEYEIYDPYTGTVTTLMGGPPPGHYPPVGHPMMTAMPYSPMTLQAVDWYNPSNPSINEHWMPSAAAHQSNTRNHKKPTADVQQVSLLNGTTQKQFAHARVKLMQTAREK
jgi:hypothetical protein